MAKRVKKPVEEFNVFLCFLCEDKTEFNAGTFSAHLRDVHTVDAAQKYQKRMLSHMDATDWYQTDYEWLKDGVVFATQSIRLARRDKNFWGQ